MEKRGKFLEGNLLEKNRKAQFYLIAAIIIVMILVGLSGLVNYISTRKKPVRFYDLSEELSEEGTRVVDYGIYTDIEIPKIIRNFTSEYFIYYTEEKERGSELVFVYGNEDNITTSSYTTENTGTISVDYGPSSFTLSGKNKYVENKTSFDPPGTQVTVKLLGTKYDFNLQEGENFFFVLTKNKTDETYIAGNPI